MSLLVVHQSVIASLERWVGNRRVSQFFQTRVKMFLSDLVDTLGDGVTAV